VWAGCIWLKIILSHYGKNMLRLSKNRVLKRIFGPKREEEVGVSRRLINEEVHKLYASPNVIRMMKSRGRNGRDL
jgi:hypothetical protein